MPQDMKFITFTVMELQQHIAHMAHLSEDEQALLSSCLSRRQLKKGEPVLQEGEYCRSLYLVEKGYLRSYYNKDGVPINLNFAFEGEFTSNLQAFVSKQPSQHTIAAGEKSVVWIFNFNLFPGNPKAYPQIAQFIRRVGMNILLRAEEHSNLFKIYTPAERYHFIELHHPQLLQRLSLSQIASYLGVTRETLSRIRNKS